MEYGEIIELGRHKLMCGDATRREDVMRLVDGVKVDLVLQEHFDAIQRLKNRLERELSGNNNQAVIDSLNSRIEKRMRQIQNITDAFRLYDFMPSQENSNNDGACLLLICNKLSIQPRTISTGGDVGGSLSY